MAFKDLTEKKNFPLMATLTTIGTIGAAVVALNTFTGLNWRPAWGFEVEKLNAESVVASEERGVQRKLLHELHRGQLELKVEQLHDDSRELRRELTRQRVQADEYRQKGEPIPQWLLDGMSDTEDLIGDRDAEKVRVRERLLELTQ